MIYAYIRTGKLKDIEYIKEMSKADIVLIDLVSEWGTSENNEFEKLVDSLEENDTVVIKSIDNLVTMSRKTQFCDINDFISLFKLCRKKNIKLISLEDKRGMDLLDVDAYKLICLIEEGINKRMNLTTKLGRPSKFPKCFLETYYKFRNKGINAYEAGKELGINYKTFYVLVKEFES
ncbi:recombinase family protein [Clostridium drakei]|uniref:Resolvase/invertase-type recombinase catalytic domain-containing protein n=1 Tax=Clostridium drakei TaxID=332101 RepID=A0A2U8DVN3_9CLOT|nr:recombinase family protein [Clostridium drakei]AWI06738.1 hypothetical protein B9W14_20305 [Clostridium drakei]